jgi:cbb3-type cytochrome oxidase cytochrome c subunit
MGNHTMRILKISFSCILIFGTFFSVTQLVTGCSGAYDGEKLFFQVGCSQCHTYYGRGGRMGPDLSAAANRRSNDWIDSYLQNPKKINPLTRMPSFSHLSRAKRKAIIRFLNK